MTNKSSIDNDDISSLKKTIRKNYSILLNDFYTPKTTLDYKIINHNSKKDIIINTNVSNDTDNNQYTHIYKKLYKYVNLTNNITNKLDKKVIDFYKRLLKFNRGTLKKKITTMYGLNFKNIDMINDAYLKLYEIFMHTNLLSTKKTYNTMHFAEAPGGFILATNTYLKVLNKNNNINHKWFANSYNPEGRPLTSILEVGKGLGDDYGLMQRHPDKWLFGNNNTGDLTNSQVIRDIRNNLKGIDLDIVTGDGGLGENSNISEERYYHNLQKLDFAQMVAIANFCTKKSHCVVKIFTNDTDNKYMKNAFDLYFGICYMYILMFETVQLIKPSMSADSTGEYYIVGRNFIGIDDNTREQLLNVLDKFTTNMSFIDVPNNIKEQLIDFFKTIAINLTNFHKKLLFLVIYRDQNIKKMIGDDYNKTKSELYFNKDKYNEQIKKFNHYWIDNNKFDLTNIYIEL